MWKSFITALIGSEEEFEPRRLLFHRIAALSAAALILSLLFSAFLLPPAISLMLFITLLILGISLWLSRVIDQYQWGISLFLAGAQVLVVVNYFVNAGIFGNTALISILIISILFGISRKKGKLIWTLLQILVFTSLVGFEYFYGRELILDYENRPSNYLDQILTFTIAVGFLYTIFEFLHRANEKQRQKILENQKEIRRQRDKFAQKNQDLHQLLRLIAHDVRNPLASIESFLDPEIQEAMSEEERQELNKDLLSLVRNTSHMLDETMAWTKSQVQAGQQIELTEAPIGTWLNPTLAHLKSMAATKDIHLLDNYDGSLHLSADPNLLMVVVRNILQNAIKFSPRGSSIEFKVEAEHGALRFSIADQGMGMDADKIAEILEGETRSTLGTDQESGTGFGLQISKQYLAMHHSKLEIESRPQEGSVFSFRIAQKPS